MAPKKVQMAGTIFIWIFKTGIWNHRHQEATVSQRQQTACTFVAGCGRRHAHQWLPKRRSSHGGQEIHDDDEDLHLGHIDAGRERKKQVWQPVTFDLLHFQASGCPWLHPPHLNALNDVTSGQTVTTQNRTSNRYMCCCETWILGLVTTTNVLLLKEGHHTSEKLDFSNRCNRSWWWRYRCAHL